MLYQQGPVVLLPSAASNHRHAGGDRGAGSGAGGGDARAEPAGVAARRCVDRVHVRSLTSRRHHDQRPGQDRRPGGEPSRTQSPTATSPTSDPRIARPGGCRRTGLERSDRLPRGRRSPYALPSPEAWACSQALLIGAIVALAIGRGDQRLRERDEIADAIGVPVLASMPVRHPSDAAGWTRLLDDYKPGAVSGVEPAQDPAASGADRRQGRQWRFSGRSLAFLRPCGPGAWSSAGGLRRFAGNPHRAGLSARSRMRTATATLQAACAVPPSAQSKRSRRLRVSVRDHEERRAAQAPR